MQNSLYKLGLVISRHAPTILTTTAVVGYCAAVVMAVKVTPKAVQALENREKEPPDNKIDHIIADVTILAPIYGPTAGVIVASTALLLFSEVLTNRRLSSMTAMYTLSDNRLRAWQKTTLESVGDKAYEKLEEEVATTQAHKFDAPPDEEVGLNVLCFDQITGRYFIVESVEFIRSAVINLNEQLITEMYVSINDLYHLLGIEQAGIGQDIGWAIENGVIELRYSPIMTPDDRPAISIDFDTSPKHITSGNLLSYSGG